MTQSPYCIQCCFISSMFLLLFSLYFAYFSSNPTLLKIYCKCWLWLLPLALPCPAQSPALTFREDHVNYQPTCLLFMLPGSPFFLEFTLPHLTQINSEGSQSIIGSHCPCLWLDLGIACNLVWPVRHAYIYSAIHSMNIYWAPTWQTQKVIVVNKTECLCPQKS